MNWRLKLLIKVLVGRFPIFKYILKQAGLFRHGHMESLEYALSVFNRHADHLRINSEVIDVIIPNALSNIDYRIPKVKGGVCLEIGPGESITTMIIAKAAGFDKSLFVDYGWQLEHDTQRYCSIVGRLKSAGFILPDIAVDDSIHKLLLKFCASYHINGIQSMKQIPTGSVDFTFSQAVFEHIPKSQVKEYVKELKRIGKKGGLSSHRIDLKDHLGGSIENLRFSTDFWESRIIYDSGVYTNRLRFSQWLEIFNEEELHFKIVCKDMFPRVPVQRKLLATEFRNLDESDLNVSGFDVIFSW